MKRLTQTLGAWPFFIAVFLNAFVDLGHKIVIQNTVFKLYDEQTQVIYTAILNGLILLPFILLLSPAGYLSDRYRRARVMRLSAWMSVVCCSVIMLAYSMGWFWLAFSMTFVMAVQSAFYSPAKLGYIKELFGKARLGEGNGVVSALSITAILSGIFVFSFAFELFFNANISSKSDALKAVAPCGILLFITALIELYMMYRLPLEPQSGTQSKLSHKKFPMKAFLKGQLFSKDLVPLKNSRSIRLSVIGLATFWAVGQVMLAAFPAFFKTQTGIENTVALQGILACSGIGIAFGSMLAGKLSKDHIEFGLLPMGALGIALGLFLLPNIESPIYAAFDFLFIGFMGGIFIVPLNALIQFQADEGELGKTLAANNWVQNLAMLSFLLLTVAFSLLDLSSKALLELIAWVALIGCAYTLYELPQSFVRFIFTVILSRHYRVRVQGMKNIPAKGGILMLGNHVSWLDWAIIQIASPRPVRFVMIRSIYERWYLKWFFDMFGCIPIEQGPRSRKALERVSELLDDGEIVCLFPEGTLSRTGHLTEFRSGYERACANVDDNVKIIPFHLHGLWGSQFSRSSERLKQSTKALSKRDLIVAFGEPLSHTKTANELKKIIFDLSIDSWNVYVDALPSLAYRWVESAKNHGGKPCLIDTTGVRLSGIEALTASTLLAYKQKRLLKGKNIGVLLPSSAGGALANMALVQNGKVLVNLNYTAGNDAIASAIEQANIKTIVSSSKFIQKLNARGFNLEPLIHTKTVIYLEDIKQNMSLLNKLCFFLLCRALPTKLLQKIICRNPDGDSTAAILFSSGSEGIPKGVCLSHKNIMANVKQTASVLNPEDNDLILGNLPLFHAFGLTVTQFLPLLESIPVAYHPDPTDVFECAKLITRQQATILFGTSTFFRLYNRNKKIHPLMLSSLRVVISGAEKLNDKVRQDFSEKFNLPIYEGYGATETTPVAAVNLPDQIGLQDYKVQLGHKRHSVGMPLPGTSCRIVDPDTYEELNTGEAGMILIGGSQVMQGYLNQDERTQNSIKIIDNIRWYVSGDKGYLDKDGFLFIVDRYSRFAKVGGEMISLSQIENCFYQMINKNSYEQNNNDRNLEIELAAVNLPNDKKGEKIILISTHNLDYISREALTKEGLNNLAIPSEYFVWDELPKLGSGKVAYTKIKQRLLDK